MRFSSSTYLALAAATVAVQAAPVAAPNALAQALAAPNGLTESLAGIDFSSIQLSARDSQVKRSDLANINSIIAELSHINSKRELIEDEAELAVLDKRTYDAFVTLVTALIQSKILSDTISTLYNTPAIWSAVLAIGKAVLDAVLAQGPALLSAIWNSGLLGKVFNDILADTALQLAFVGIIPDLLAIAEEIISFFFGSSSTPTTTAAAATPSAKKRELKRELYNEDINASAFISQRDLITTLESILSAIWNSGIVQSIWSYVKANPGLVFQDILTVAKYGLTIATDVYKWLQSSGYLKTLYGWISPYLGSLGPIIGELLGVNGTTTSTPSGSATATPTTAPVTLPTGTTVPTAATQPASVNNILSSLQAQYGSSAKKRRNY